ncbi:MAG: phospho-sugar mutase [Candidatus Nanopelagicales bacterium]
MNLIATARDWLANDPHEETQHQLRMLIEQAGKADPQALKELHDSFDGTLQFGTAGLRGTLGPGPNRMNLVVVARAAAGLAQYLLEQEIASPSVVIGFDARHNSELFANVSAQIFSGYGIAAKLFPHATPTPVVAFAIRHLNASAGVVVTASHNPPQDNGYKVYLGSGSQIIPPADTEISECIARATASGPVRELPHGTQWEIIGPEVEAAYVQRTASIATAALGTDLVTVYTAMHGVGGQLFLDIVKAAGFPAPVPVSAQFEPNAAFPTVAFPNPEEPGAIDLAVETAKAHKADLIIANDPDADRCAVAIPINKDRSEWRMLHGDEVGSLLAAHIAQKKVTGVFAQSIVSSTQLKAIAELHGFDYQQTLTGFKWIGPIPNLVFGYEEALGYCVDPEFVKDKDGLSAAVTVMELASQLKSVGKTLQDELTRIAIEVGVYATDQVSVRVSDLSRIPEIMEHLRTHPPTEIAGSAVTEFIDLARGSNQLPPTDGLLFTLDGGSRIIVRPSGTEPKVKVYLQSVVPVPTPDQLAASRTQAIGRIAAMAQVAKTWLD